MDINFIILAGGKSKRLGRNKVVEKVGNKSLLERVVSKLSTFKREILIVIGEDSTLPQLAGYSGIRIIKDLYPGKGALGGVYTGLYSAKTNYNTIVGCDMPFLNLDLIRYMMNLTECVDVVIPKTIDNILEPLHAIYSKNCLDKIESLLEQNRLSILDLYPLVKVRYVEQTEVNQYDNKNLSFFNINNEEDLKKGKELLEKEDIESDQC